MPTPRNYLSSTDAIDRVAVYATSGPRSLPIGMLKRCNACSGYLASDNQQGVNNTSLCSPCYVTKDQREVSLISGMVNHGVDPVKAYVAALGVHPQGMAIKPRREAAA
jgi:hypothetical protein